MSSHHVVRENQEPALIISYTTDFDYETAGQLLEWSPFVLVLEDNIDIVLAMGIKVDAWVHTVAHTAKKNQATITQYGIEEICIGNAQTNILEFAIDYLLKKGFSAVNIIGETISEVNQSLIANKNNQIKIVLINTDYKLFCVEKCYEKWLPQGTSIDIMPFGLATNVVTIGAILDLNTAFLLVKKTIVVKEDGFFSVKYQGGILFINEKWY